MDTRNSSEIMPHARDQALARSAAAGDPIAWRKIYDDTCQPLFNFLCYQTGNRETARDLLQETYLKAHGRLHTYGGRGSLLGWLRGVALRQCLDWRRRLKRRVRKLAELAREISSQSPPTTTQETFPGLGDGLQRALDRLSPRQRAALLLRELEDLPFAEIADSLGCSEATARVHHHRACANLRRWLETGEDLIFGAGTEGMMS